MRVVKPTDGRDAAERRLAAAMLNIEHAAVAYGPDCAPLPAPHEPWPLIRIPPLTAKGLPVTVHYRATVGVVFYTAGADFRVNRLVSRVADLLSAVPEDHLKTYRAAAVTPATVLRHRGRVSGGNIIVGPRKCYKKPSVEKADLPARLLMWTPEADLNLPVHYSIRAAFTWVFMPITAALAIQSLDTMSEVNATVASVFYDCALLARHPDGAEIPRVALADFDFPRLPPGLAAAAEAGSFGHRATGALVVCPASGGLSYVGNYLSLRNAPRSAAHLPEAPWDPDALALRAPGAFQCCFCEAPVSGDVVLIGDPRAPAAARHREWFYLRVEPGTPLLAEGRKLLLCLHCWGALDSPACLTDHMGARLERARAPLSQAQACAACPGYEGLAELLGGAAAPVRGVRGAFTVQTPGGAVVLASGRLGTYPALTVPEIAALGLPVIPGLRIAEAAAS